MSRGCVIPKKKGESIEIFITLTVTREHEIGIFRLKTCTIMI